MKFNKTSSSKTVNYAGGEAYKESPKLELATILLTSFVKDQFYRSENETLEKVRSLIYCVDPVFSAKAAIYARNVYGMRSITHVVAGEIAKKVKGEKWTKSFFDKIVHRPDDMMEILAYYYSLGLKNEPNALKKGFANALGRFNEYELGKYRGEKSEVSLVDVVNLVHPKTTPAIEKLIKGTLRSKDTWEVELSMTNGDEKLKKLAWHKLISERKIGYFALLRNLRNIIEQAPEDVEKACELLIDKELIKKSLVLPFRFITAIKEIEQLQDSGRVLKALNTAIDISMSNVPHMSGKTLVVLDTSGSMEGKPIEIGSLFASVLVKSNDTDFMWFSNDASYLTLNPSDSTLTIARQIVDRCEVGGTNFHSIFQTANRAYDRIIIMSDMQGWTGHTAPVSSFNEYKTRCGSNPFIYSFDLQGYGTLQFPEPQVFCIAGFSEKVFDIMSLLEKDKNALIKEIEKIEL